MEGEWKVKVRNELAGGQHSYVLAMSMFRQTFHIFFNPPPFE
jgi:hypothetical protein